MRTSQKHIYTAGDVPGGYLFTRMAGYQGGIIFSSAIFHLPRKADHSFLPWCTYTYPELADIGMNEFAAKNKAIDYSVWSEEFKTDDRGLSAGEETGMIKMILNAKKQPVGVQIFGQHAGDLIGDWVAALNGGVKLSRLVSAVHPYPTIGEINKKVVAKFLSKKIFSDRMQRGLKFFFSLRGRAWGE